MANEKRLDLINRGELLDAEYLVSMDGALGYVVDSEIVRRAKRVDAVEVVRVQLQQCWTRNPDNHKDYGTCYCRGFNKGIQKHENGYCEKGKRRNDHGK